jgi:cyanate permease
MMASKLGPRFGIKRLLLTANGFAIIANLIKIIEKSTTIFLGRVMFAICAGASNFCIGKAINETVPTEHS